MKTIKIIYKIILITMLFIICNSCMCYADGESSGDVGTATVITGDQSKGLPDIGTGYKPVPVLGDSQSIIEKVLGAFTVIGVISIVVSIALIGLNTIFGSAGEKAVNQEKFVGLFIAAVVMTGGSTLAQIIIKFAENI